MGNIEILRDFKGIEPKGVLFIFRTFRTFWNVINRKCSMLICGSFLQSTSCFVHYICSFRVHVRKFAIVSICWITMEALCTCLCICGVLRFLLFIVDVYPYDSRMDVNDQTSSMMQFA